MSIVRADVSSDQVPEGVNFPNGIRYGSAVVFRVRRNNRYLGIAGGYEGAFSLGWGEQPDQIFWKQL